MFYIVIAMCLVGYEPKECTSFASPPMFLGHEQCAQYVASDQFKVTDIASLVNMAKGALPGKDGDKIEWQADCKQAK